MAISGTVISWCGSGATDLTLHIDYTANTFLVIGSIMCGDYMHSKCMFYGLCANEVKQHYM